MPNGEELGRRVLYFYHQIPASNKANDLPIRLSFCIFPSLFIFSFSLALDFLSPLPLLCRIPCACKETIASLYVIYLPLAVSNDLYF